MRNALALRDSNFKGTTKCLYTKVLGGGQTEKIVAFDREGRVCHNETTP